MARETKAAARAQELKNLEARGCVFRFQPAGCEIAGYESVGYTHDSVATGGVWAFASLRAAIADLFNEYDGDGYAAEIEAAGLEAELVVIEGGDEEDGPEAFVIRRGGRIVARYSVATLADDESIQSFED